MGSVSALAVTSILQHVPVRRAVDLPHPRPAPTARWPEAVLLDVWRAVLDDGGTPFDPAWRSSLDGFGLFGYVIQTAPDAAAALSAAAEIFAMISDRGTWSRTDDRMTWTAPWPSSDAAAASDASTVAHFAAGLLRIAGPGSVCEVRLRWDATTGAAWLRSQGVVVRTAAERDEIVLGALDARPSHAHPGLFAHLRREASAIVDDIPRGVVDRTRHAFVSGATTVDDAAKTLGVSVRTLRRRLRAAGTSAAEILDETRRAEARGRVRRGDPLVDVADAVGFSDPSALARAYRRWFGVSPSADRR